MEMIVNTQKSIEIREHLEYISRLHIKLKASSRLSPVFNKRTCVLHGSTQTLDILTYVFVSST